MAKTFFSLGADDAADSWRDIRSHRAEPSASLGRMLKGHREQVFHMALEQSQQQFQAAGSIGYESRPLNLFYGLAQAGRAICAASQNLGGNSNPDLKVWLPEGGHGITFRTTLSGDRGLLGEELKLQNGSSDAFSRLSHALGSPLDFPAVTFGRLLAQLPEVWLQFRKTDWGPVPLLPNGLSAVQTMSFPAQWEIEAPGLSATRGLKLDEVQTWVDQYPALVGLRPATDQNGELEATREGHIKMVFPSAESGYSPDGHHFFPNGTQMYRRHEMIFPGVGGSTSLHPLASWWMVLFALSMLARYSPRDWSGLMSLQNSPLASVVEYVLDVALDVVPNLVAEALETLNRSTA